MPEGTRVHRLVKKLKRKPKSKQPRNVYAVAQTATGQSYATGRPLKKKASSHSSHKKPKAMSGHFTRDHNPRKYMG